jgi:hypothetical protein
MINDISLNAEQRERLNSVLDGCFWDACFVDEKARIGISVVELIGFVLKISESGALTRRCSCAIRCSGGLIHEYAQVA